MPKETINIVRRSEVTSRVHVGWDNHGTAVQIGVEIPGIDGKYDSLWSDNLTEAELSAIIKQLKRVKRKRFPVTD